MSCQSASTQKLAFASQGINLFLTQNVPVLLLIRSRFRHPANGEPVREPLKTTGHQAEEQSQKPVSENEKNVRSNHMETEV